MVLLCEYGLDLHPPRWEGSSSGPNVATAAVTVSTDSGGVAAAGLSSASTTAGL